MGDVGCSSRAAERHAVSVMNSAARFCKPLLGFLALGSALLACGLDHPAAFEREAALVEKPITTPFSIIAHRGGASFAPENTLPAFRRSLALGFPQVELDVRLSRDEQLMLFHDEELEPKTGRSGTVGDYTAAELRDFDIGSWFDREHPQIAELYAGTGLSTLSELFEEFGSRLYYHVEIKGEDPRMPALVVRRIDEFDLWQHATVTSFSREQVERVHALAPDLPVCWLIRRSPEKLRDERALLAHHRSSIDEAARAGLVPIAISADEFSAETVATAHERGLWIRAYGVKTVEDEERVIRDGADGATTDWPWRLRERLYGLQKADEEGVDAEGSGGR